MSYAVPKKQLNRSSARWVTWQKGGGEEQGEGLGFNTKKTRKAKLDENFYFIDEQLGAESTWLT